MNRKYYITDGTINLYTAFSSNYLFFFFFYCYLNNINYIENDFYIIHFYIIFYMYIFTINTILFKMRRLIIGGITSQIVATPNIGRLLILHSLQFWTLCDPMSESTAVTATAFVCDKTRKIFLSL